MTAKYEPGLRVSEYLLEERLGAGAFGEVWRARHHIWPDERVAVKLPIEPDYVRYLQREGLVVHGLRHPNIVGVRGFDPYAEIPYLVLELVRGPSLRDAIAERGAGMPVEVVVSVLRGVLGGLIFAHANRIFHRDLKPANVLLDLNGAPLESLSPIQVRISDFGFGGGQVDTLRSIAQSLSMERDDQLVGTLAYMAPELRDGGQPDATADLYALGVMLFEMLTGERPAGAELPSTLRADAPEALDQMFRRLYARADRRYASAQAALDDLEERWLSRRPASRKTLGPPPIPAGQRSTSPCPRCGVTPGAQDQFCTHCGEQLAATIRRCAKCGAFPARHDEYCIHCGEALSAPARSG